MMLAVTTVMGAVAGNRSGQQMRDIAAHRLAGVATRAEGELNLMEVYQNDQLALIGDTAVGFAVVSRDVAQRPVLAYSLEPFSAGEMPPAVSWWLRQMTSRLTERTPLTTRSGMVAVPNFVNTLWHQSTPYNDECPKGLKGRCLTGCVATAMAQIMKYYEYPQQAKGKGHYKVVAVTRDVTINSTYDWSKMSNKYDSSSGTTNKKAVAQLMFDAGCSVGMDYGTESSAASDADAARAFFDIFGYDSLAIGYRMRGFYSDEEWMGMVYQEMAEKRPVLYSGLDSEKESGHAFLLTGNDEDGLIYVNWGWGDSKPFNGFFDIDGLSLEGNTFDSSHSMITGLKPQGQSGASQELTSLWGCDAPYSLTATGKNTLELQYEGFMYNLCVTYFTGVIDFYFKNTSTGAVETKTFLDFHGDPVTFTYGLDGETLHKDTKTIDVTSLPAGTYEFFIGTKGRVGERIQSEPTEIRTAGGYCPHILLTKADDGTLTVGGTPPTAISTPHSRQGDGVTYDLRGHRLTTPVSQGIYIRDGRKFVQK